MKNGPNIVGIQQKNAQRNAVGIQESFSMKKLYKKSDTEESSYIPIKDCIDRHLYIIKARNADIGIYLAEEKAFKISRFKFTSNFIDIEYHWDIEPVQLLSPPFPKLMGTVKPLKELGHFEDSDDIQMLNRLNKKMKEMLYDIKELKKEITTPIILIDSDRMKMLRILN